MQVNPSEVSARAATAAVGIDVRRLPGIKRLAADYAYAFGSLAPFFAGDPSDRTAWADAIARVQSQQSHRERRREVASVVRAQQHRRGAPPAAVAATERLADDRAVAILTGQQAGLFGGPLFTLLKALTALKLAEQVTRDHGVPAAAVFWIEAEDHDWDEVRSCTVFDSEMATRTISLPPRTGDPMPVASIAVDNQIENVLSELEHVLPATEFRAPLISDLRAAYAPGRGMAEAFARWLERVLGDRGLIVYDASDPAAKPFVGRLFSHELSSPGQTAKLAAQAGADLVARGFHAQVQASEDSVALFRLDAQGRRPIQARNGNFVVNDQAVTAAAMVKEAAEQPAGFSPSVLLRPIVQDTIFPTVCYVAGPNELAYLGQLRGIYQRFGVPMPLMYGRASATLADSAAARFLSKYNVAFESLQAQDDSMLNELLRTQIPAEVDEAIAAATRATEEHMTHVIEVLPSLDPTLEGAARTTLSRMQKDLETLQSKTIQAAKRRNETLRRQFLRTRSLAFPNGHAQERTIGFVSFLNQYGSSLVERLWQELPLGLGQHWIVTI